MMKRLFNKLSAFLLALICMPAAMQAEILHHEQCVPTKTQRGFSQECWENTETRKIYSDVSCTQELERKSVVTYAVLDNSPIKEMSSDFQSIGNKEDWGITFNWAARTTFMNANAILHPDARYVKFTVADDNAAYARLMWNKNFGDYHQGTFKVSIIVNNIKVYELDQQQQTIEGVRDVYFKKLKKGDEVTFKVCQTGKGTWANDEGVFFTACFEYMIGDEVGPEPAYDMEEPEDDPTDPDDDITGTAMVVKMKNGDVTRIAAKKIAKVEWTDQDPFAITGKAKAIINGSEVDVNWVRLWKDGPKFAEYNVGATSATEYGGYYAWGGHQDKVDDSKPGSSVLTGNDDTATYLWGSNWRMPTKAELDALLAKCEVEWTTINDVKGRKFTGIDDYAGNSIFLPAAGYFQYTDEELGSTGNYWCSTPRESDAYNAYRLNIRYGSQITDYNNRSLRYSVRAVLAK